MKKIKMVRNANEINFYNQKGKRVYPLNISGNIAEFANGEMILI